MNKGPRRRCPYIEMPRHTLSCVSEMFLTQDETFKPVSLPKTLSTAENLRLSPDGRNRDVPIRVPLAIAGCDLQLRRMEFLVGTVGFIPLAPDLRHRRPCMKTGCA